MSMHPREYFANIHNLEGLIMRYDYLASLRLYYGRT